MAEMAIETVLSPAPINAEQSFLPEILNKVSDGEAGMERSSGCHEFGCCLLLADRLRLGNGGPRVDLLDHAIAGVGHHPDWGCLVRLGEIGIHRLGAVVINEVVFHVLGHGARHQ